MSKGEWFFVGFIIGSVIVGFLSLFTVWLMVGRGLEVEAEK